MSHQTGISCSNELKEVICKALNGAPIRSIQVAIEDEKLICRNSYQRQYESYEEDFDQATSDLIEKDKPCYLFLKLKSSQEWLFITYSPDNAVTREKMLYAATRATLKSEFGGTYVVDEYFATTPQEVSYHGYMEHVQSRNAPPPLTDAEEEKKYIDETESKSAIGATTKHRTAQGIDFPLTESAEDAIRGYTDGTYTHVELNIEVEKEVIKSAAQHNIEATDLCNVVSEDRAAYHLFNYIHHYDHKDIESHVFIYFMPGYSVPIKERMLYSSCKGALIDKLEEDYGVSFSKKLECDKSLELTAGFLRDEIHPPVVEARKKFSKPVGPGRKAPSRVRRPKIDQEDEEDR